MKLFSAELALKKLEYEIDAASSWAVSSVTSTKVLSKTLLFIEVSLSKLRELKVRINTAKNKSSPFLSVTAPMSFYEAELLAEEVDRRAAFNLCVGKSLVKLHDTTLSLSPDIDVYFQTYRKLIEVKTSLQEKMYLAAIEIDV